MVSATKSWVKVCAFDSLPPDKASDLNVAGQRLAIARCGDQARIFQGFCSHMLFPLAGSPVTDCTLTCSLHQSKFDIRDGSVVEWSTFPPLVGQALAAIRKHKTLRTYETKVENGDVYILWATSDPDNIMVRLKPAV